MAQIRKYAFDTEFTPDGGIVRDAQKRLSPEEIEAERTRVYEQAKKDALVAAERDAAAQLQNLADAASAILTRLDAESRAMREEAARVAMAAARKIAGAAIDAYGADTIAAAIESAMDALRHQPRLVVRLAPELVETLKPRIDDMSAAHAYAGAVLVRAEPGMKRGAVIVDWSDGVVSLDPAETTERVNALVEATLASANAAQ
jgi:flagellar assembly protein FliH